MGEKKEEPTAVSDINDLTSAIRDAVSKAGKGGGGGGGGEAINEVLMADNFKYRERHREDQRTIEELQQRVPGDGAIVIPADQAKSLGIEKPEDVQKMAADLKDLKDQTASQDRKAVHSQAAEALGWDQAVMERLPGMEEGRIELRTERVTEDGETKSVQVPYIIPGGEDAAAERLADYAKNQESWEPFMAALVKDGDGTDTTSTESKRTDGTPFPRQPAKGGKAGSKGDPVDQFIEKSNKRAEAPNPLRPKARAGSE